MTYFTAALDSDQLDLLRGIDSDPQYATQQLAFLCPNEDVFQARVNGAVTGAPFAEIDFDNVTFGDIDDVKIGQRIIISPTNNKRNPDALTCRVRATPSGSSTGTIPINEISTDVADDSYIFVVNDYPLMDRLARVVSINPLVQAKDYDLTFQKLPPMVAGIQMSYVKRVSGGVARFTFNASNSYPTDDSATSTLSFQYTFVAGTYAVISGSLSTHTVEVDIDEGFQWGQLVVSDSNGVSTTFHFQIHAWGDTYTPVLGFEGASISDSEGTGRSVSVVAFADVDEVLDNTWITIVRYAEQYGYETQQLIAGDAYYVEFVGLFSAETIQSEGDPTLALVSDVSFEITGIGQRLSQINMQAIGMRIDSAPDAWDEIKQLMPWRAIVHIWARHSTASTLIPLAFSVDVKNSSYTYPYLATPLNGNLLSSINYLLNGINAALEFWPNGSVEAARDIRYKPEVERVGYFTLFDIEMQDVYSVAVNRRHLPPVGKVYAEGGSYNGVTGTVTAFKAIAPGTAQQIGTDVPTLGQQILTVTAVLSEAQSELNQRAGNFNAIMNDDGNSIVLTLPGGYAPCFYPSKNVLYTFTYDDPVRGIVYDTNTSWMCTSVSIDHNNDTGIHTVNVTLIRLIPFASAGDTIPAIAPGDIPLAIPDLPPFPAFGFEPPDISFPLAGLDISQIDPKALMPPAGKVAKADGNTLLVGSTDGTQAFLITNFIALTTPQAYEVTPPDLGDFTIHAVLFDPFNVGDNKPSASRYAFILASDDTDSQVFYTENIFARPPEWNSVGTIPGEFTVIRGTNTPGSIEIYSPTSVTPDSTVTITFDPGGSAYTLYLGTIVASGNPGNAVSVVPDAGAYFVEVGAFIETSGDIDVQFDFNPLYFSGHGPSATVQWELYNDGALAATGSFGDISGTMDAWFTASGLTITNSADIDEVRLRVGCAAVRIETPPGGHLWVDNIVYTYTPTPLDARTILSEDYAQSWGAPVEVGDPPGSVGGFDAQKASTNLFAAADNQVKVATTLDGTYANAGGGAFSDDPSCIIQPYYRRNSTTTKNTTAADPDYIVGLNGGTDTLYWVDGLTNTQNNITPVASATIPGPNCVTTQYGTKLAAIVNDGGTRKLYTSTAGGGSPTFRQNLTDDANYLRTRRGDTSGKQAGDFGQLIVANGLTFIYSKDWGATRATRNMPVSCDKFDVLG